jgi:hypothetical protein
MMPIDLVLAILFGIRWILTGKELPEKPLSIKILFGL